MGKEVRQRQGWLDVDETIDDAITAAYPITVAHGGTGQTTEAEALGEMTQALTEDTAPDRIADMAPVYDDSADTGKKVALWRHSGMAVLATGTVTNQTSLDLPLDTTGYSNFRLFKLIVEFIPLTDTTVLYLRFSDDGGATFEADASDYGWAWNLTNDTATGSGADAVPVGDAADSEIHLSGNSVGNATGEGGVAEILIHNPASAAPTHVTWSLNYRTAAGAFSNMTGGGIFFGVLAATDVRLLMSSGNITATYTLMGIA